MSWMLLFVVFANDVTDYGRLEHMPTYAECEKVRTFLAKNMPQYKEGICVPQTRIR